MSEPPRDKWNQRYTGADLAAQRPAQVLTEHSHLLPAQGLALDLACGLGANALLLARCGLTVDAWDISDVAIEKLHMLARRHHLPIAGKPCDVLNEPLPPHHYDVIVVSRFLERDLCPAIIAALRPNGLLFYQTWTLEKVNPSGPGNPHYLLEPNELLQLFAPLRIVVYREEGTIGDVQRGVRNEALLIALRRC